MDAIVYTKYGPPAVLQLREVDKPTPKDNEVLIKVHAASLNDWDWGLLRGKPFVNRLPFGLRTPQDKILGSDIAGIVEAIGENIKLFHVGGEVFGDLTSRGWGGFAEYVCAPEDRLILKPANMTFEQAAAIPQAAVLALQSLRDKLSVQPGQSILINGAGGGTGSFAIQMAKSFGAEVTCVDSTEKLEVMRSVGADHVIDYTQEDFTKNGQQYDLIVDLMGYHRLFDYKRSLSQKGTYVMVGGSSGLIFKVLIIGSLLSLFGKKKYSLLLHKVNKHMDKIIELFEAGKVIPVIDKIFPLSKTREAFIYFGEKHTKGKVVISLEEYF